MRNFMVSMALMLSLGLVAPTSASAKEDTARAAALQQLKNNGGAAYVTSFTVPQDTVDPKAGAFRYTAKPNASGGCPSSVVVKFNGAPDAVANVEVR